MKRLYRVSFLLVVLVVCTVMANAKYSASTSTSKKAVVSNVESVSPAQAGYGWVVITGNGVRIRTAPHLHGKIVGKVNRGNYLPYLGYVDGWFQVRYRGSARWVSDQYAYFSE